MWRDDGKGQPEVEEANPDKAAADDEAALADGVDNKETPLLAQDKAANPSIQEKHTHPDQDDDAASVDMYNSDSSYSDVYHPNDPRCNKKRHVYTGCAKYLNRFDEMIMRPIFIYRYERSMMKKSREFIKLFMNHGAEIEADFN